MSQDLEGIPICGPSSSELSAQANSVDLSKQMSADFSKRFDEQSDFIAGIKARLAPTLTGGASAHGFSAQELAARNTAAIDSVGAANANAQRAISGELAGRRGDSGLESGIDSQIKASVTSKMASDLADKQLDITNQDFAVGRDEYHRAIADEVSGENSLIRLSDPTALGHDATAANKDSFLEANTINQAQNQELADVGGFVGGFFSPGLFGHGGG